MPAFGPDGPEEPSGNHHQLSIEPGGCDQLPSNHGNTATAFGVLPTMTVRATWHGAVLAESDGTVVVEGNHYFPAEDVHNQYFEASETTSVCPWKGTASYRTVVVDGARNDDAAWYYPEPKEAASEITDHVAFWNGVTVEAAD